MTAYDYRCPLDGTFERHLPMGAAPPRSCCPACGAEAGRVFSAPRLSRAHPGALALIDAGERSASEPDVVAAPPARGGPRARPPLAANPALAHLPRP